MKKAYRKLDKKYHPDTNHDNLQAEEKFKGNEAFVYKIFRKLLALCIDEC